VAALIRALTRRPPLQGSVEVLTPIIADPLSVIPLVVATGTVLAAPSNVARLARDTVNAYGVTPDAIHALTRAIGQDSAQ
jgi:hypothetical protein